MALLLGACSSAEDAARGAADAAGQEARRAAEDVATQAVKSRVCSAASDGQVSEAEVSVMRTAVAGAEGAGLPAEITEAVRGVVGGTGDASRDAVQRLQDACAR